MGISLRKAVALALAAAACTTHAQDFSGQTLETVLITAKRDDRVSKGATGLDLDIADTPQSISVVTSDQMDKFGADNINDALRLATGINVEEWETNRTNYMARGFEIKNTQIDGVGLPNDWGIVTGAMDSFGYEKLEVIRGANGLLTGVGNSSGTINYVRKRPTNVAQFSIEASGGSFDQRRIEADYSTPFTADGKWAGRVVVAAEDQDSYLRLLSNDRTFVYGVVDGQLGDRSTLTLGASYQEANTDGNMWGALVLAYSDGTQAEFPRNATTALDWTYWDTKNTTAFAEYTFKLAEAWDFKLTYNYRQYEDESSLFFACVRKSAASIATRGWGCWAIRAIGQHSPRRIWWKRPVSGRFELFGREHEAMLGLSYGNSELIQNVQYAAADDPSWGALPPFPYPGDVFAEPAWGPVERDSLLDQTLKRGFGATRLSVTDKLKAIVGFNYSEYHRDGDLTGVPFDQTESEISPYAGLTLPGARTVDALCQLLRYLSAAGSIRHHRPLPGRIEGPELRSGREGRVAASGVCWRRWRCSRRSRKAWPTFAGMTEDAQYYYEGVDVSSKGIEVEVVGRLSENVDLVFGFTSLQLEGAQGEDIYEWVPRQTANISLSGTSAELQGDFIGDQRPVAERYLKLDEYTNVIIRQDSYATLNAFARWDVTDKLHVRANVRNITDEKYITSLYQIGFYGAPRNYEVGVGYKF